jgi:hypothetical protein
MDKAALESMRAWIRESCGDGPDEAETERRMAAYFDALGALDQERILERGWLALFIEEDESAARKAT